MVYFLKATSENQLIAALLSAEIVYMSYSEEAEVDGVSTPVAYVINPEYALDVIGTIYKPTGAVQTVDGMEVPEMAAVPGWHANLRGELSDTQLAALEPILLEQPPAQPYRVWA